MGKVITESSMYISQCRCVDGLKVLSPFGKRSSIWAYLVVTLSATVAIEYR